nr:hypothetical protein [Pseudoxanthomonas indica]
MTVKKTTANKRAGRRGTTRKSVTPAQALAKTQALLARKRQHDREPAPWQQLDHGHNAAAPKESGAQSPAAANKQVELHAAESRMKAIQGSMSARDRRSQGKRDHRGDE